MNLFCWGSWELHILWALFIKENNAEKKKPHSRPQLDLIFLRFLIRKLFVKKGIDVVMDDPLQKSKYFTFRQAISRLLARKDLFDAILS